MDPHNTRQLMSYVVPGLVILLVLGLRMRRMSQVRPLRLERLWIVPVIYLIIVALAFEETPPVMGDLPWLLAAAALGGIIGWYRGKMMQIIVDPDTHALNQKASPLALIFLIAVIGLRYGVRFLLAGQAKTLGVGVGALADSPLTLAAGMFIVMRVEMFMRAQHLLAEAREAKANKIAGSTAKNIVE